jgi:hypothetical protein
MTQEMIKLMIGIQSSLSLHFFDPQKQSSLLPGTLLTS